MAASVGGSPISSLLLMCSNPRNCLKFCRVRRKERCMIIVFVVLFVFICFGALNYVPDRKDGSKIVDVVGIGNYFSTGEEIKPIDNPKDKPKVVYMNTGADNSELKKIVDGLGPQDHNEIKEVIRKDKLQFIEKKKEEEAAKRWQDVEKLLQKKEPHKSAADLGIDEGAPKDPEIKQKRDFIVKMMDAAWGGYVRNAFGENELKPISKRGHSAGIFGSSSMGATIVDSLDTLYLMGKYDEFKKGRDWIATHLNFNVPALVSVFEVTIRFLGGLLSAYAFTSDEVFKIKAKELADRLLPAFNTATGIPFALVNLQSGATTNYGWASGGMSILSEFGTLHMEFSYLSEITGDKIYLSKVNRIREHMMSVSKPNGLYPNYMDPRTGNFGQQHVSLGALGDSFYEYLLKSWIQSGKKDKATIKMYLDAMKAIEPVLVKKSNSGLTYLAIYNYGSYEHKMEHLACFAGGMFALGSKDAPDDVAEHHMQLGKEIAHTCHESYKRSATGIGPESFRFEGPHEAIGLRSSEKYYILRPEVVETYYVMWRLTHDNKYRQWAWEAAEAIEKHCHVGDGYSGIRDVTATSVIHDDVQQSFFLAETLKYLYLIFSDDTLLPMDKWVLNTEAHPLPVAAN